MRRVILRRISAFIPTILLVSVVAFCLRLIIPGGPAEAILGIGATPSAVAAMNKQLGLDRPLVSQYASWLRGIAHGNLGTSYSSGEPVSTVLSQRAGPTVEIVLGALIVSVLCGCGLGILAAVRRHGLVGRGILGISGLGISVPDFWLGTIAAGIFGLKLGWVPAVGFTPLSAGIFPNLRSVVLPVLVLSMVAGALIVRQIRSSMVAVLGSSYIRTAWAMGVRPRTIYFNYALRNAISPIVTFLPLLVASLVGASVLVETVFGIAGLGSGIVNAASNRDFPTLQAIVLILAVIVLCLNLVADVALAALDPRIRRS